MNRKSIVAVALACLGFSVAGWAAPKSVVVNDVRLEILSPTVLRFEVKGPKGFEDRSTFHVVNRPEKDVQFTKQSEQETTVVQLSDATVRIANDAKSLADIVVLSKDQKPLWQGTQLPPNNPWLPDPGSCPNVWAFSDTPRMARSDSPDAPKTGDVGWDTSNDAADVYVLLPHGDYRQLRTDFLKLTGPTEMMPLYAFGAWDSRWYEYNEKTALEQIDAYRSRNIPLDVLVVDTDWRNGGSHGYDVNTRDFPDLKRFFDAAHDAHVRVMFNDHPEPVAKSALDPAELKYRTENLTKLLKEGLDIWWYDRNWHTHLHSPMDGLRLEAWGIELYRDITAAERPERRPLIMANVVGIDNGIRNAAPDVAAHRNPTQWTGDIKPTFDTLAGSVANAVDAGVSNCFAYQSDDLGGHVADPTPEGFIRWIEFGALSPVYRPHCTRDLKRMPWAFGDEAEKIARNFVQMRYRLLPTLYAAAHENYTTGEPILRRLDLEYPDEADAKREDQYLLGHDLLVAPIIKGSGAKSLPEGLLKTSDGQPGLSAEFFDNDQLRGEPVVRRTDAAIDFNWHRGSPAPKIPNDHFSARWTGKIGPMPGKAGDQFTLFATSDDGVRVWLDGKLVIDRWMGQDNVTTAASLALDAGKTYDIKVEYNDLQFDAAIRLSLSQIGSVTEAQSRGLWVPPGSWINLWTGETVQGPKGVDVKAPLDQIPLFARSGSMVLLAPDMQYTGQKPWDSITVDLYPDQTQDAQATLYEDDGESVAYQKNEFRMTPLRASAAGDGQVKLHIDPAKGTFAHAPAARSWIVHVHPLNGRGCTEAFVNGQPVAMTTVSRDVHAMPLSNNASPDADVMRVTLPSAAVEQARDLTLRFAE